MEVSKKLDNAKGALYFVEYRVSDDCCDAFCWSQRQIL